MIFTQHSNGNWHRVEKGEKMSQDNLWDPECDACGFKFPNPYEVKQYRRHAPKEGEPENRLLCALCAGTTAGNKYPYDDQRTLRTITYVGNAIIQEIKKLDQS